MNDSNLENWSDDSGLFETFSSLLSSISRVQSPADLSSSHLHHNLPNSNLCVNNSKLQVDKDTIPCSPKITCSTTCESNLILSEDNK